MSETKITLYHANWCGHCKNFLPQWNALTKYFDSNNISHQDFEDQINPLEIEKAGINGFPTIRISKNDKEYDYVGERSVDAIINEVTSNEVTSNEVTPQTGGSIISSKRVYINYTK